ncbi:MAG: hypothetical protein IH608_07665, partial [Proteobacteria bacterium]|nr:hypothetical protein [Pseudomonadota bacterium]
YRVLPAVDRGTLVAVLPVENLSSVKAPLREIGDALASALGGRGFRLLPAPQLEEFMRARRMRYTGGIGAADAAALRDETGAEAVLISSLETYQESGPPKVALTCRLVLCGPVPEIIWVDSVGPTGDDRIGLLELGRVAGVQPLTAQAVAALMASLEEYLAGKSPMPAGSRGKYWPGERYRAPDFDPGEHYTVAVVPFLNRYARKNAGFVVPLHFVTALSRYENLRVVEPGLVREQLLTYRLIMPAGPSLAVSDILASRTSLEADLILSGQVFDYQDLRGTPKVDFSTQAFAGQERTVVWWSRSRGAGDDGVWFFDAGRERSASHLLQSMTGAIGALLMSPKQPPEMANEPISTLERGNAR